VACSSTNGQTSSSVCNPAPPYCHGQSITFAGLDQGNTDGSGSSASFYNPTDVVIDSSNNLYVTDPLNSSIRKITPDGIVSTFKTVSGHLPSNITIDLNGNFIIVDGNVIRRVTLAGAISTIAGGGMGSQDGNSTVASFMAPSATAIDSAGNIYVADTGNNIIRKITPGNIVSTYAGTTTGATISYNSDGPAATATFANPVDVAVGPTGIVYVLCQYPPAIRAISADGNSVTTLAGSTDGYTDGTGTAAKFKGPTHISIEPTSGNIYVADTGNARIRIVTPSGVVTTYAGNSVPGRADGIGSTISFNNPMGMAFDSSGNLFVVDSTNNIIRKIFK
jgi:sugar lactone lactonase YvrE